MEKLPYRLSSILVGHGEDVRDITAFENGTIVSVSRDKTARVWVPNRDDYEFSPSTILRGHTNFVSSVCVLNPTEKYPNSLIITGSNDHHICIYKLGESEPMKKVKAHADTVCNLRAGIEEGTFLSSSWDLSAKLWSLDNVEESLLTLHGHSLAIWCVIDLPNKAIVTGSADKNVIVWNREGAQVHKLEGHTDCVRDIAAIKADEFLTCANDATVRHWNALTGNNLGVYYGHDNYIYSISATFDGSLVATSSEDKSVRIWKNGKVDQTLMIPTTSVWCVDILPNGDIVSGSSDGIIRIFSADSSRWASPEIMKVYEAAIIDDQTKSQQALGNVKINELPTMSALAQPGTKDGQTKMINQGGKAIAYSWSQSEMQWIKIGDVVGAVNNDSPKQLFDGKEYDYVFSIDIQDGVPPLKLPYNKTDDPWHTAQTFIHKHGLSQMYLDQIANFIVKNSDSTPSFNPNSSFADPFTGGNRYIPGSGLPNAPAAQADPFTGGNRYIPGSNQPNAKVQASTSNPDPFTGSNSYVPEPSSSITLREPIPDSSNASTLSYIPHGSYIKLEQANYAAILEKIKEFNSQLGECLKRIPESNLEAVVSLAKGQLQQPDAQIVSTLWTLLEWPNEFVFPVLDVARLAVLQKSGNDILCSENLIPVIQRHLGPEAVAANQMLIFRLLANMFNHETGEKFGLQYAESVLDVLLKLPSAGSKHNQVAIATYMLNLTVALNKNSDDITSHTKILNLMTVLMDKLKDPEAIFRALVALGTLIAVVNNADHKNTLVQLLKQSDSTIALLKSSSISKSMLDAHGKVSKCSKQILDLIV
ncbi:Similar to Plaa: Phospholipase A-2-activating protein (Rattus norvegicus) [Cotesia congregata]|uniref:Similar to Plaa: Phospholipase A-2-activating protein (Rattus norvegicus) n=1 Tax=Cotesia congregata TaxID=51543 RepID=A0A8J2HMM2_COTCN|nr:Similar to Plaa: Phospholipase A-2-activating protein (Rattus norvegicus) [Cotesia congregata]